jgi:hypothetical protein
MRRGSVTLDDLAGRIAMLEVACSRCERRGRLRVDRLIEQHGDMELPELGLILSGDWSPVIEIWREASSHAQRHGEDVSDCHSFHPSYR